MKVTDKGEVISIFVDSVHVTDMRRLYQDPASGNFWQIGHKEVLSDLTVAKILGSRKIVRFVPRMDGAGIYAFEIFLEKQKVDLERPITTTERVAALEKQMEDVLRRLELVENSTRKY